MTYSIYDASVPLLTNGLAALDHFVTKAEEYAKEKGIDVAELLQARLVEDMLPFTFQIHSATDTAMKTLRRIQGVEPDEFKNDLVTVDDIRQRIAKTRELLKTAERSVFEARTNEIVKLGLGGGKVIELPAAGYVNIYGLPNFFFHLQTAYAILRSKGVSVGKSDYLAHFRSPYVQN